MAKKTSEAGRFVTLQSGRVIFIPAGERSRWADVRDRIGGAEAGRIRFGSGREYPREKEPPGEAPRVKGVSAEAVSGHLKRGGWEEVEAVGRGKGASHTRPVDVGGGYVGHITVSHKTGGVAAAIRKPGGPIAHAFDLKQIPSVEEFRKAASRRLPALRRRLKRGGIEVE